MALPVSLNLTLKVYSAYSFVRIEHFSTNLGCKGWHKMKFMERKNNNFRFANVFLLHLYVFTQINGAFGENMLKKYALVAFFFLAYLFTWSNWLPQALTSRGITSIQVPGFLTILSGYGPALAAIIVVSLAYGRQGLRELFGRLLRWRVGIQWYLIALFMPAFVILLAISINKWTGAAHLTFRLQDSHSIPLTRRYCRNLSSCY